MQIYYWIVQTNYCNQMLTVEILVSCMRGISTSVHVTENQWPFSALCTVNLYINYVIVACIMMNDPLKLIL